MWSWLEHLLYGPPYAEAATPPVTAAEPVQEVALPPPGRSSLVFDSHILTEAATGTTPQAVSLAWDEGRAYGYNVAPQNWLGMTPRERKETLLSIFLTNPWASNCIDTIALYIISGGYSIEPRVQHPDENQRKEIEKFLLRVNEDWDFLQFAYDQLTDEMIFGESFTEFTVHQRVPWQLFPVDCLTMEARHDKYGRVTKFLQQLTSTSQVEEFKPDTFIRWWNPHKRSKVDPFSPLERIQDAILLDKKMTDWTTTFFHRGAKYPYYFKGLGDQDEAERFLAYYRANFTGEKNAQTPPVVWGDAEIVPLGNDGSIDIDFDKGLDRQQIIVLSAMHVPPAIACISESGNRLTDMSDSQRKILEYIACNPRKRRFFEKFNYRLIFPFFGTDYYVSTRYADFRDDKALAEVADIRVKNGTLLPNEVRQEMGKEPYKKGGDVAVIITSKEVTPLERLDELADEQRQTTQAALDTAKANADLAQTKAKQAKEPPTVPGSGANQGDDTDDQDTQSRTTANPRQQKAPAKAAESAYHAARQEVAAAAIGAGPGNAARRFQRADHDATYRQGDRGSQEVASPHTGMMLALLLDAETAAQLALPGGEPANDLHITLAYLGDIEDKDFSDGRYRPHTEPVMIQRVLKAVTSAAAPLVGKVGGVGCFSTPMQMPVIATVDVPGLAELRHELVTALDQANYYVAYDHGYTPHITLDYVQPGDPVTLKFLPALPLTFDVVWLCVGGERIPFKLGSFEPPTKESNEEPETHAQSATPDAALVERADQTAGDRALHEVQETLSGGRAGDDGSRDPESVATEAASTSVANTHKSELASWIAALFLSVKTRGNLANPDVATAIAAYALSDQEQESLAHKLAEVNLAAQVFGYNGIMTTIGILGPGIVTTQADLLPWGRAQVASITKTMQEQLGNFIRWLPEDTNLVSALNDWVDRYRAWKSPQVANYTWGSGQDEGSLAALNDVMDMATDPTQPGIVSTDNIKIRVVPPESSSDYCKEYAGQSYAVDEYLGLGMRWPAHPNCIHSIGAYVVDAAGMDSGVSVDDIPGGEV